MSTNSISVVIVTYNRLDKLKLALEHVQTQTHPIQRIVIVDNASTDETQEFLEKACTADARIQNYRAEKNLGGAGGFNRGIKLAYQDATDFIWVMDDDCYAEPDALEKLVSGWTSFSGDTGYFPGFACSMVKWHDDICEMNIPETVWDWPRFFSAGRRNLILVKHCSFVSALIPRQRVKEVGLPLSEFFIWFDDVEYTKRLAHSYPGIYVMDSLVHHDLPENKGVNFGLVNKENLWKYKYGARNQAYYHRQRGYRAWLGFALKIRETMKNRKVPKRIKWEIYRSLFEGARMRVSVEQV